MTTEVVNEAHVIKVLVLGDAGTGKTSIIKRYVHNFFSGQHKSTIGVDFHLKHLTIGDSTIRLQLWDIAGQDRFGAIARVYYKEALGAMLVYDVSRPSTFETVTKWKDEIDSKITLPNGQPLPVLLLGNKSDLEEANIDQTQLDVFCQQQGFVGWLDTSAKTNKNIDKAAKLLVTKILEHQDVLNKPKKAPIAGVQNLGYQPGMGHKSSRTFGCC